MTTNEWSKHHISCINRVLFDPTVIEHTIYCTPGECTGIQIVIFNLHNR